MFVAAVSLTDLNARHSFFFSDPRLDRELPVANQAFWSALIGHIEGDGGSHPKVILDIGCHTGGLLEQLSNRFGPDQIIGIEPLPSARRAASERLSEVAPEVRLIDSSEWDRIPARSVDLLVGHEVLYLEADLADFMRRIRSVMAPHGSAYVVLGCHSENPLWQIWKETIVVAGHSVYDHSPVRIMEAASSAGLLPSVQPLMRWGWVTYDPLRAHFHYPDVRTMLDHHYRHKLIFRLKIIDDESTTPS